MKSFYLYFVIFFGMGNLWLVSPISAQTDEKVTEIDSDNKPKNYTLNGYLKFMQTASFQDISKNWTVDNLIHNRLNFKWYMSNSFTFTAELRNRIFYGETVKYFPNYADITAQDYGWLDMNWTVFEGQSVFMNSTIDRLYLDIVSGNWEFRIGRQRLNWGQTFVWNPNDIFNTYSFLDFDYEERPGSDAILIRRYLGVTSSAEFAIAPAEKWDDYTLAAKLLTNRLGYDFQFIAGKFKSDYIVGLGWTGAIKGAGFKGEMSYFYPIDGNSSGQFLGTIGLDYTHKKWTFQGEFLYNSQPSTLASDFDLTAPLTAKTLSYVPFSTFLTLSYQITPLTNLGLGGIWNPDDKSYFLSPSLGISLGDNTGLYFVAQIFGGSDDSMFGTMAGSALFGRVKWSF